MKKLFLIVFSLLALFPIASKSQWRQIATFQCPIGPAISDLAISSIYFLDLPGHPRIGFIGITSRCSSDTLASEGSEVWRTIDGGTSWNMIGGTNGRSLFGYGVNDFVFKDSLIGWLASYTYGVEACYKTIDGGLNWKLAVGIMGRGLSLCYHKATNRLFLSQEGGWQTLVSLDEGNTWQGLGFNSMSCLFCSDSIGICTGTEPNSIGYSPNYITTDGGRSWLPMDRSLMTRRPLAIMGTKTFFILDDTCRLYRSDDAGRVWREVYHFPVHFPFHDKYATTEELFGDLTRMYAQTQDGVFESTDEGVSWESLCGPPDDLGGIGLRKGFYLKSNYIYAAEYHDPNHPARLWVNKTVGEKTPRVILSSTTGSNHIAARAGSAVSLELRTPSAFPTGFEADSLSISVTFDSDVLSHLIDSSVPGWTMQTISNENGLMKLQLNKSAGTVLHPDSIIAWINFRVNLAPRLSTTITLNEVNWDADTSYHDCMVASLSSADSVLLNVTLSCGDTLMLQMLRGQKPSFDIVSLRPNPASGVLHIDLKNNLGAPIRVQLFDALGVIKKDEQWKMSEPTLDVSTLPSGIYYLRLSQANSVQTRKVVVQK